MLIALGTIVSACSDENPVTEPPEPSFIQGEKFYNDDGTRTTAELNDLLSIDSDAHSLIDRAKDLRDRAEDLGVVEEVQEAYHNGDVEQVRQLMDFSSSEENAIQSDIESHVDAIYDKYPEVEAEVQQQISLGSSDASYALNGRCLERPGSVFGSQSEETSLFHFASTDASVSAAGCQWLQFVVALSLCSATGPGWYWPCAYLAACNYCDNAFTRVACF